MKIVDKTAAGVSADGAVNQRRRAIVVDATAEDLVIAARDGEARKSCRGARFDLEYTVGDARRRVVAFYGHARPRARDRLGPGLVAQLELAQGRIKVDRLRRVEHRFVERDRLGSSVRIRQGDRLAQVGLAGDGRVGGVVDDDRG